MSRTAGLVLALVLGCGGCATGGGGDALRDALDELVARPDLAGGRIGVMVVDAADGRVLAEHEADRGFATASNMKLLSAAVALTTLGPDYTMATELVARGEVRDGVLEGDLVLRGRGDPTFGEGEAGQAALESFVAALRELHLRTVTGRVLGDGSWLGPEMRGLGWQWDYLADDYAAPFGGLCYRGNVVTLLVRPDASLRFVPFADEAPVVSLTPGAAGSATRIDVRCDARGRELVVEGTIAADATEQRVVVAVRDPARFAAAALAEALRGTVEIAAGAAPLPGGEHVLASHRSPPLAAIVKPMLEHSNNLYAEQVWRVAARVATGDGGTASAERHAKAVLASLGVDTAHMVLADGSGLSRRNLVQPRQIVQVLVAMHHGVHHEAFTAGLPVAGFTGTLRSRFPDGPARGRVRAKTGFVARVVCLSGYVPRRDPAAPPLVFSIMLNDFTCDDGVAKAAADEFVQRLAAFAGW
jgi:D-alanyl-D-alanine carboxypeptidase/D-alanyl-D-alanine-endopeptidase (penicillin-binding protein 4)